MKKATHAASQSLIEHIERLPMHGTDRETARAEFDRAERAADWTVRTIGRFEALLDAMRRAARVGQRRTG